MRRMLAAPGAERGAAMGDYSFPETRRIVYGEGATFLPRCAGPKGDGNGGCGRIVKADQLIDFDAEAQPVTPNATCARCGRVAMWWEGYY